MNQTEILDTPDVDQKTTVLFSRFSIVLTTIIFSPIFGAILYCANLRFTQQKEKIFGTYITIILCNFFAFIPFAGFYFNDLSFNPLLYISPISSALLMIYPFWNKHFEGIEYETIFPYARFFLFLVINIALVFYEYWKYTHYTFYDPAPSYLISVTSYSSFMLLPLVLIIRFVYLIVKRKNVI